MRKIACPFHIKISLDSDCTCVDHFIKLKELELVVSQKGLNMVYVMCIKFTLEKGHNQ